MSEDLYTSIKWRGSLYGERSLRTAGHVARRRRHHPTDKPRHYPAGLRAYFHYLWPSNGQYLINGGHFQ